jgi:hypothetical protein
MVPSIASILQRFTGEWATLRQPDAILAVCSEIGYTPGSRGSGRVRRFFDQARLQSMSSR